MDNESPSTLIFSFKVTCSGGNASGRVEATDAAHAQQRIQDRYGAVSGGIKLLANQEAARSKPFWKI